MEKAKQNMESVRQLLAILGVLFLLLFAPTLIFLSKGNQVAAAVTGTMTLGIILAVTHVSAFAVGAWYTKGAMTMGADVALRAQETNDRWDERKTVAFGQLMREGARIGRQVAGGQPNVMPLPLPSQGLDWLPPVSALDTGEDDVDLYND